MNGDVNELALRQDIRATLMPGFSGTQVPEWVFDALADGLRAVCVYGENIVSAEQAAELGRALREAAPEALLAIDEEGGEVTRLHYRTGAPYPGAAVLGRIDDEGYTSAVGRAVGSDLRAAGFSLALAPDADVNAQPRNPVIGTRSFGAEPETVARHVAAWVRGIHGSGVLACPKHFPGHGDTSEDSHLALPAVTASAQVIAERDLPPFAAAIEAGAAAIMTSHILLPELDPSAPATMSRAILIGLLREQLGFDGVIVTDALDMRGASGDIGIPEAAVRALTAGCDLLCLGAGTGMEGLRLVEDHVLRAIDSGRLDAARVRSAAGRVRALQETAAVLARSAVTDAAPTLPVARGRRPTSDAELRRIAESFGRTDRTDGWLRAHPHAAVWRIDHEANMAVGDAPWGPFAVEALPLAGITALAGAFGRRLRASPETDPALLRESGVMVIGRSLPQAPEAIARIDALRAAGVSTLVIDMGWAGTDSRYADISCFGSSALVGAALLLLIESDPR